MDLIILVGLPGSGKTLFAKYMQSVRNNMFRVSWKDVYSMIDYKYNIDHQPIYTLVYYNLVRLLLSKHHLIIDDNNLTILERQTLVEIAKVRGAKIHVYQMAVTPQMCISTAVAPSVMEELVRAYEYPTVSEGFEAVYGVRWALADSPLIIADGVVLDRKPEIFDIESKLKIAPKRGY